MTNGSTTARRNAIARRGIHKKGENDKQKGRDLEKESIKRWGDEEISIKIK